MYSTIEEISVGSTKQLFHGPCIDDDLLLFPEFGSVPVPEVPKRMGCLLVGLCLRGEARYTVDTEERLVKANDVIIISEGQVVNNSQLSCDFSGIAIMMSENFFNEVLKGVHDLSSLFLFSRKHPVFGLRIDEVENLMSYFQKIQSKVEAQEHAFRRDVVRSLLAAMIYDIGHVMYGVQQGGAKKQTRAESIFTEFIRLVEQNYRSERRVSWYGEQLCITPKYLSETVKAISQRTPNEWIDKYVTLELRVQLKNTSKSIKEIAKDLNFPNQSFLGKYFKEHVGVSPSAYRRN
ncbi:helix-turn-helix domain-containing protein [uncultured Prevotella sp.]|uniref:helix-turn-helix domain-containing protein n=1 Tax=uncultured Prevotella sp. TaxID=159272 RepID=UPI00261AD328|nr:helix-turn-helix domain-containing protein [uncultured Prevotella sp.]